MKHWLSWAASRAALIVLMTASPSQVNVLFDVKLYQQWFAQSLSHGHVPHDTQWNYPPGAAVTLWLAGLMGPYVLGLIVLMLAADAAIFRIILRKATDKAGPWLWVIGPLLLGPVVLSRFDLAPTFFAVAGLFAGPFGAGVLLATGGLIKVWPAVLLGLRLLSAESKKRVDMAYGASHVIFGSLAVIAVAGQWSSVGTWLGGNGARGLQIESVAATPWLIARALGFHVTDPHNHGSVQISGWGTTLTATVCSVLAILVVLMAARAVHQGADLVATSAAAILALTVTSKVLSPQYLVWSLALVALVKSRRAMLLLGAAALLTQVIYPTSYLTFIDGGVVLTLVMSLRNVLLVACTVECIRVALASRHGESISTRRELSTSQRHSVSTHARPALPMPRAAGESLSSPTKVAATAD